MSARKSARQKSTQQRAVIFTHFGDLKYGNSEDEWLNKRETYLAKYTDIFKSYLICAEHGQLGLVYVYVDWAIRQTLPHVTEQTFLIDPRHLGQEAELVAVLELAEEEAREQLHMSRDALPRFRHIGLFQLVNLLNKLAEVNRDLVKQLGGLGGILFTYDSPKFAEAVIRLARGAHAPLAGSPVIRVDEDAKPSAGFIRTLLKEYVRSARENSFFFFSGTYGSDVADPINDFAVRTAWLADVPQESPVRLTEKQTKQAHAFLSSLSQIGATQIRDPSDKRSRSPQVISGAGLLMSFRAVQMFPPFMNFKNLTVWVDDYLKRRLHEAVGDIPRQAAESLQEARIKQDRHPRGLWQEDIDWAKSNYFDRLLRGCLFDHLITEPDKKYANLLGDIKSFRLRNGVDPGVRQNLRTHLLQLATKRYEQVMKCWSSKEFAGTAINDWIVSLPADHCQKSCDEVVDDADRYIDLLLDWPVFTSAIRDLQVPGNYWLFVDAN